MKLLHQICLGILVGAILVLVGCASGPTAAESDAFRKAVEETWELYSESILNEDTELFVSIHDENIVKMPPGKPVSLGSKALGKLIQGAFDALDYESFSIKLEDTQVDGNLGVAWGTYTFRATVTASGATINYDGKYLTVFKRQPDGSWKALRDCYNSNVPPPK